MPGCPRQGLLRRRHSPPPYTYYHLDIYVLSGPGLSGATLNHQPPLSCATRRISHTPSASSRAGLARLTSSTRHRRCAAESACSVPCYLPMPATRTPAGNLSLRRSDIDSHGERYRLPCGSCLGCRLSSALSWAVRCSLEHATHDYSNWLTLTYDEAHCPPTLSRAHLQLFLRKVRRISEPARIRFFGCGEYGEINSRPHYHLLLWGPTRKDADLQAAWARGHVSFADVTPERIAYTAGYVAKKVGPRELRREHVDPVTGEWWKTQPPFLQMSRRPGIGGDARTNFPDSWRSHAVYKSRPVPVPRFLHLAWKSQATPQQISQLEDEQLSKPRPDLSSEALDAAFSIAIAKQKQRLSLRNL